MIENKKGKGQLSPTKKGGPSFDDNEVKEIFPDFPPFFADIHALLKEDHLIKEYEREHLYELERARVLDLKEQLTGSGLVGFIEKKIYSKGETDFPQKRENPYIDPRDDIAFHIQGEGGAEFKSDISLDVHPEQFSKYKDPFGSHYMTNNFSSPSWARYHHKSFEAFELFQKNDIEEEKIILEQERVESQKEEFLGSYPLSATPPPPRGEREKSGKVVKEFHHLFPCYDIIVRESEEMSAASLFCEAIAKDIVNRSAELYVSRCFEAIKEGYTAHSIWEELRDSVACSFLPQDFWPALHSSKRIPLCCPASRENNDGFGSEKKKDSENSLQHFQSPRSSSTLPLTTIFGYIGDCIDCQEGAHHRRYKKLVHNDHYLGQDIPSSLLLSAASKLKLSSSQCLSASEYNRHPNMRDEARKNTEGRALAGTNRYIDPSLLAPDDAPPSVPIDEYCRYVVPIITPPAVIVQPSHSGAPPLAEVPRAPLVSIELKEPATSVANTKRDKEVKADPRHSFQAHKRLSRISSKRKKSDSGIYRAEALVVQEKEDDNLTAALKKVPQAYFFKPSLMPSDNSPTDAADALHSSRKSSAPAAYKTSDIVKGELEGARSNALLSANLPGSRSGSRKSKLEKNISLVNIEKDKVLLARDANDLFKNSGVQKKRNSMKHDSVTECFSTISGAPITGGDGHRLVSFEVQLPEDPPATAPENGTQPSLRPPSRRLVREETKKIIERKRWKELEEQKEREKLFVFPLHQPEEIQNHVDVKPQPGVQVQCLLSSAPFGTTHTHSRAHPLKDDPVVLIDGGEYIIPENKQRWMNDTKKSKNTTARKKQGGTISGGGSKKVNSIVSSSGLPAKGPIISAQKESALPPVQEGSKGGRSNRLLHRTTPKIMRSSRFFRSDSAVGLSKMVVAHSAANVSRNRVGLLPVIAPSSREDPVKRTKQTSVLQQEQMNIVASALAELS